MTMNETVYKKISMKDLITLELEVSAALYPKVAFNKKMKKMRFEAAHERTSSLIEMREIIHRVANDGYE